MRFALLWLAVIGGGGCTAVLDFDWKQDAGPPAPDADHTPDAPPLGPDSFEPNEGHTGAPLITPGTIPDLSIFPATDVDFFQFTTVDMRDVTVEAQFQYTDGDLDLFVYRFDTGLMQLVEIARSTNFSSDEALTITALGPGDYWIKVQSFDNVFTNTYTLVLTIP
jgi:hypothetical protein